MAPAALRVAQWQGTDRCVLAMDGVQLEFELSHRSQLAQAARHAGALLATAVSDALLLTLACIGQRGTLPAGSDLPLLAGIARSLPLPTSNAAALPQRAVRDLAQDALAAGAAGLAVPDDRWNAARVLLAIGAAAWALDTGARAWWGTTPMVVYSNAEVEQMRVRVALGALAGLAATPDILTALPIAPAPQAMTPEVWVEWVCLAQGPGTPPPMLRPDGLGAQGSSPLEINSDEEAYSLTFAQGTALDLAARALLASLDRPSPRHLGALLDVAIPDDLLPQVAAWGVATLRVQPHTRGLWVAALASDDRSLAAAWWEATPASSGRAPLSFPPAAWALFHPVLAGLWHDLCADAISAEAGPRQQRQASQSGGRKRGGGKGVVYLPPVKHAVWADAADRDALKRARRSWQGYRLLPHGWEERKTKRDFLRRRQAAVVRAKALGLLPPPPGYTVQRAGVVIADSNPTPRAVRATGLFAAYLAANATLTMADDDDA